MTYAYGVAPRQAVEYRWKRFIAESILGLVSTQPTIEVIIFVFITVQNRLEPLGRG